jgi:hypothetical protein
MFSKQRKSFSRANISEQFLAAAKAFASANKETPVSETGDKPSEENELPDTNAAAANASASKRVKSKTMFPLLIPVEAAPKIPPKTRLPEDEDAGSASERGKRVRLSSVDGEEEQDGPGTAMIRQAISNGSDGGSVANRLAKTDVRFAEIKRKLLEAQSSLTTALKRAENAEREIERLKSENRDLRRKLDAGSQSSLKHHSSGEDSGAVFTIKLENVDKSMTSKALLQMAESFGGEVTMARIMKASNGVLNAYCSFSEEKDALKAMEQFKKQGMTVSVVNTASAESASASKTRAASSSGSAMSASATKSKGRWRM